MMDSTLTEADFERLSWHDNHIYGLHLAIGDPDRNDWRSDLVLDIDHIVEWIPGAAGRPRFRVAPATLTFHHVTDLRLDLAWGDSGFQVSINEASIDNVSRVAVADQKVCLDRPYYAWRIATNLPRGGLIAFGAVGFSQTLRAAPVVIDEQKLSSVGRAGLGG